MKTSLFLLLAALMALASPSAWPGNSRFYEVEQTGLNEIPEMPAPGPGTPKTCSGNQVMRGLDGLTPICVPASCPAGFALRGVTNNQPVCDPNVGWGVKCNGNQVLQGFDASGNAVCVDAPAGAQGPQGPAGIAGAGLWLARGTGCGACPYGPVDGNAVSYCKVKDQAGNLRAVKFVGYGCSPVQSFAFWTY